MNDQEIQVLYDAETIRAKVEQLGAEIDADHPDSHLVVVSILGGSVVFLADLIRAIKQPLRYETVRVHYTPAQAEDILEIQYPISLNVRDQTVVVVRDVMSTGVIDNYLANQFSDRGASRVRFAALVDLPEERKVDIQPDYRLFTPKRTGIFVGYGLKVNGRYGNLPYLGRLAGEEKRADLESGSATDR